MKIRTIAVVLGLDSSRPSRNGKSFFACGQKAILPLFSHFEMDDRMLLYDHDVVKVCNTIGESVAAICNYKPHKFYFPSALSMVIEAAYSLDEEDELWIFALTDRYCRKSMDFPCGVALESAKSLNVNNTACSIHLWSVGAEEINLPGAACLLLEDAADLTCAHFVEPVFSANKAECQEGIVRGCSPLSV